MMLSSSAAYSIWIPFCLPWAFSTPAKSPISILNSPASFPSLLPKCTRVCRIQSHPAQWIHRSINLNLHLWITGYTKKKKMYNFPGIYCVSLWWSHYWRCVYRACNDRFILGPSFLVHEGHRWGIRHLAEQSRGSVSGDRFAPPPPPTKSIVKPKLVANYTRKRENPTTHRTLANQTKKIVLGIE